MEEGKKAEDQTWTCQCSGQSDQEEPLTETKRSGSEVRGEPQERTVSEAKRRKWFEKVGDVGWKIQLIK